MSVNPTLQNLSDLVPLPPAGQSPDLSDPAVYDLVCRVYRSRYAQRVTAAGVDEDDGLQAVCLGMITRARSPGSRWNPARAGLARWVYVVTESIVGHIEQAQRRGKRQFDLSDDGAFDPPATTPPEGSDLGLALGRLSQVFDLEEEREMAVAAANLPDEGEIDAFCAALAPHLSGGAARFAIGKSSFLYRALYGRELLRTVPCPEHKGEWSGVEMPADWPNTNACPHGCELTGWLPAVAP